MQTPLENGLLGVSLMARVRAVSLNKAKHAVPFKTSVCCSLNKLINRAKQAFFFFGGQRVPESRFRIRTSVHPVHGLLGQAPC